MRGPTRLRSVLGLALSLAILLAAPATALAGGGYDLSFQLGAGDGYRITVGGYDATAAVTVAKPDPSHGRYAWSTYVARGKVSPTAIHAGFGALGRVDMRFHQSGPVTYGRRHHHCVGADRYKIRRGVFVGSVRFRGEGGYVSAKVHRVKGKVLTPRFLTCFDSLFEELEGGGGRHGAKSRPKVTRLYSFLRSGLTAIFLSAAERGGKARFVAEMEQTVGSLGVIRGSARARLARHLRRQQHAQLRRHHATTAVQRFRRLPARPDRQEEPDRLPGGLLPGCPERAPDRSALQNPADAQLVASRVSPSP